MNSADREYWAKTKKKLLRSTPDHQKGCHLSDEDKKRIVRLFNKGFTVYKISKTMGKNSTTIRLYLYQAGLREIGETPSAFKKNKPATAGQPLEPVAAGLVK